MLEYIRNTPMGNSLYYINIILSPFEKIVSMPLLLSRGQTWGQTRYDHCTYASHLDCKDDDKQLRSDLHAEFLSG